MTQTPFMRHLPPQLQQQLQQWYTLSLLAVGALLMSCVAISLLSYTQLTQLQTTAHVTTESSTVMLSEHETAVLQKAHHRHRIYTMLQHFLNALPSSVTLISCSIDPEVHLIFSGTTPHHRDIALTLSAGAQAGFPTVAEITTTPHEKGILLRGRLTPSHIIKQG